MKNIVFIIFSVAVTVFQVSAQKHPVHAKKVYVSPQGKIYFNKSLPVYFFISTKPNNEAPHYQLPSETTPKYANPMYLDTEGVNTLRSPSAVDTITKEVILPEMDVQFHVYADSKTPVTKISFEKTNVTLIKGIHYVSDSLTINFDKEDEESGVENTYISIDSGAYKPIKQAMFLDVEKEYIIKYYSVDNTGNAETPKEIKFYIDKTAPVSNLAIEGDKFENVLSGETQLHITATDNISGLNRINVSIDDSIFRTYNNKINTTNLTQGNHKLFYYAADKVNNKENVNVYSFFVDKTPPQVIEEVQGKTFTANGKEFSAGTSKLKITSFDNKAGVKEIYYSLNNSPYELYEKPIVLSGFKGNLLIKSYAVDNVGNKSLNDFSNSRKNSLSYVDLSAPWVGHSFKGSVFNERDTVFINQKTNIVLEAKDTESGIQKIEYQIDNNDLMKYENPLKLKEEGYHQISIYGYDNTDNLTRQEFGVMVDTTGPEIFERFSSVPLGLVTTDSAKFSLYPSHVVVFLSATDLKAGFETISFEQNNKPFQPYMRDIRGFKSGKNAIRVRAYDKLGNITEKRVEFYVK